MNIPGSKEKLGYKPSERIGRDGAEKTKLALGGGGSAPAKGET